MIKKAFLTLLATFCMITAFADTPTSTNDTTPMGERDDVQAFIHTMVEKYGFSEKGLTNTFNQVKVRPKVIQSIKHPAEANPWNLYKRLFITPTKVSNGVAFWKANAKTLARAKKEYGVDPSVIVATVGIETNYGQNTGKFRVIDALADLAFNYPNRSKYFKYELEEFLLLTREQHEDPLSVKGSYAGAIGQPQFMPDSVRHYAVDFSGTNTIDLTNDMQDIIGSIAHYYEAHGWQENKAIAYPATLKKEAEPDITFNSAKHLYALNTLNKEGLTLNPHTPPQTNKIMPLALDTVYGKRYWMGFNNFLVIMRYNSSPLYAMAVTELAKQINEQYTHDNTPSRA